MPAILVTLVHSREVQTPPTTLPPSAPPHSLSLAPFISLPSHLAPTNSTVYVSSLIDVCHDSCICVPWFFHVCDVTEKELCGELPAKARKYIADWLELNRVTLRLGMYVLTHVYACITHLCMNHDSFVRVTWLRHMRDMTHSIHVCHVTCVYTWLHKFVSVNGLVDKLGMTNSCV